MTLFGSGVTSTFMTTMLPVKSRCESLKAPSHCPYIGEKNKCVNRCIKLSGASDTWLEIRKFQSFGLDCILDRAVMVRIRGDVKLRGILTDQREDLVC